MNDSILETLSATEHAAIMTKAQVRHYAAGDILFTEGDPAGDIYFIIRGEISISIEKFATPQVITVLGAGEYFGEMAMLLNQTRTATAISRTATQLAAVNKSDFLALLAADHVLANKVQRMLSVRMEERLLKENVQKTMGIGAESLHIGIKGDPSLRESSFTRERYCSAVDAILPTLLPRLEELLLETVVHECSIHFNSGEIRLRSLLDPFNDSVHAAERLLNRDYLTRHFPRLDYADKTAMVTRLYHALASDAAYHGLPETFQRLFHTLYGNWQAVDPQRIRLLLSRLSMLRELENFYVRNFTLSTTRDLIRIQFNCDGTHILSADYYEQFIRENIGLEETS